MLRHSAVISLHQVFETKCVKTYANRLVMDALTSLLMPFFINGRFERCWFEL